MADCMTTVEFLSEWQRMCDTVKICMRCDIPVDSITGASCIQFVRKNRETAIRIVQKWSDEHPLPPSKTYADVFFEQHPKATRLENGRPRAYRCEVYGCECKYKCPPDVIDSTFNTDRDPCKICWDEPYPEQEVST